MQTFISNLIPQLKAYSKKLDDVSMLTSKQWVAINDIEDTKMVYFFRPNKDLIVSTNGKVAKGKWEYLSSDSLLIDIGQESFLFRQGFFDDQVLLLKLDNINKYAFFVSEAKYEESLKHQNKVEAYLTNKYLSPTRTITPSNTQTLNSKKPVIQTINPSISHSSNTTSSTSKTAKDESPWWSYLILILFVLGGVITAAVNYGVLSDALNRGEKLTDHIQTCLIFLGAIGFLLYMAYIWFFDD